MELGAIKGDYSKNGFSTRIDDLAYPLRLCLRGRDRRLKQPKDVLMSAPHQEQVKLHTARLAIGNLNLRHHGRDNIPLIGMAQATASIVYSVDWI